MPLSETDTNTDRPTASAKPAQVVFVTGSSGAGRSTAINALEDLGFEAIDNLPLGLVARLLEAGPPERPLALGVDIRTRDFGPEPLLAVYARLRDDPAFDADLVYVDCAPATLQRRYSETRRRHPMAPDADPVDGIALERELIHPLKGHATVLLDTTDMTPHDMRAEIARFFAQDKAPGLTIQLTSFSYRRGLPVGADLVFDCRFLRNPHWDESLRAIDGRNTRIHAYIAEDPRFNEFRVNVLSLLTLLLPGFQDEGKSHLTVAFGCTGGRHRSVSMVEIVGSSLAEAGWRVSKRHRDVDRDRGPVQAATASNGDEGAD